MSGPLDFARMVQQLGLVGNVAYDPITNKNKGMNPLANTEGARPYYGGGTAPLKDFTSGRIQPTQTNVDWKGVKKYMKRIEAGERPVVEIAPNAGTYYERGRGEFHIKDGHHRLRAYYELGIPDVPVKLK